MWMIFICLSNLLITTNNMGYDSTKWLGRGRIRKLSLSGGIGFFGWYVMVLYIRRSYVLVWYRMVLMI